MPVQVKNIRVHEYGKIQIDSWETEAVQLLDDEVFVKVFTAPLKLVDIAIVNGEKKFQNQFPFSLGVEAYGQIEQVGKGLNSNLVGKKVLIATLKGTFTTYGTFSRQNVYVLDADTNLALVNQGFLLNPLTAAGLVHVAQEAKANAIIYTAASSYIGKWITIFAVKNKIKTIAIIRNDKHAASLKAFGADAVLNSSDSNFDELLKEQIDKLKPTALLDALAGSFPPTILTKMPEGSHLWSYGNLEADSLEGVSFRNISNKKGIKGFNVFYDFIEKEKHSDMEKLINKIYKDDKIVEQVTQEMNFEKVEEGLQLLQAEKQRKIVLKF